MTGDQVLTLLTWAIFVLLFVFVLRTALRQPLWANINVVLLFAMPTAIIAVGAAAALGLIRPGPIPNAVNIGLLLAVPLFMLRLVDDFLSTPVWLLRASMLLFVLLVLGGFVFLPPRPLWLTALQVLYLVGIQLFAAVAFGWAARGAVGVTRRRMRSVAVGALLLGLTIVATTLRTLAPWMQQLTELLALASGVSYALGFAPPLSLRRSWQEPELRAFLRTANRLPHDADQEQTLALLEREAAAALGTQQAAIGLWDEAQQRLDFTRHNPALFAPPDPATATGRAFLSQQPAFATYRNSTYRTVTPAPSVLTGSWPRAVLAAPITAGAQRFGVLTVSSEHAPIVVADDLDLVALLASQIAAMFVSRALVTELARVRAETAATRLKDDFLSVAAHDLKTPLTTVIAQTQRLARRMQSDPHASEYLSGVELVAQEALRLRRIVNDLLDAARAERGQIISDREPVDVTSLVHEVAARYDSPRHRCIVTDDGALVGLYDRLRIQQVVEHLLDNAVLYSPAGGVVTLVVRCQQAQAVLTVTDHGIGIPPEELPRLFERFFRGSNVDDRQYPGLGLSLFICRAIVEQHGGSIRATSQLSQGTTFEVTLPLDMGEVRHHAA